MTEIGATRIWGMRLAFAAVVCIILFFRLLPLDMTPNSWIGPDFLLAFAFAWSTRRPEFVPILALAGLFLLADLLLQRPPGLWALCALLACERLKSRTRGSAGEATFAGEWMAVAIAATAVTLGYRFVLLITIVPLPSLGFVLLELVATILFYPIAVALSHWGLGVRRPSPGELERPVGKLR